MHGKFQLGLIILIICACSAGLLFSYTSNQASAPSEIAPPETIVSAEDLETKQTSRVDALTLYNLINAHRAENTLSELKSNALLEKSAQLKLKDMVDNEYWKHEDKSDTQSWYLFNQAGYDYKLAGENLAFGFNTAWDVFDEWVKSEAHNKELLTPEYEDMGLAIDCDTYKQKKDTSCIVVLHLGAN